MRFPLRLQAMADILKRHGTVFGHAWRHRHALAGPGHDRLEASFLPAALSLQETPAPAAPRVAMWLLIGFAACALGWAVVGQVDIVATARGKVVPNGRTKTIQPFERSTIQAIRVSDGQRVRAGDVLIEFDATLTAADRDRLIRELASARLQVARAQGVLGAMASGQPPSLARPVDVPDVLWQDNLRLVESQYTEYVDKRRRLDAEILQREAEESSAGELVRKLEQTVPMARARAQDFRDLSEKNFISHHGYLEKEQARIELEGDLAAQRGRLKELAAALQSARSARVAFLSEARRVQLDSVNEGMQRAGGLELELLKANSNNQRNVLTAPVDGTVQQLAVHTVGGVVKEAEPLMLVVPADGEVEIEALLENKDVGFVRAGQRAEVKVETFQYTRYGTLPAKVVFVSNDAIEDRERGLVYPTRVRLDRTWLDVDGQPVHLSPGMAVALEIKTGRRRVIEFFLSPLMQYQQESLKER